MAENATSRRSHRWQPGDDWLIHQVGVTTIECPLPSCEWVEYLPIIDPPADALASIFGVGTMTQTAAAQHQWEIERLSSQHTDSHSKTELMAAIIELKGRS